MFDTFYDDESGVNSQIKTYECTMKTYRVGDSVENIVLPSNHSILTTYGMVINVVDNVIVSFTLNAESDSISDKWLRVIPSPADCDNWYDRMRDKKCDYWG